MTGFRDDMSVERDGTRALRLSFRADPESRSNREPSKQGSNVSSSCIVDLKGLPKARAYD
jgi:hypothetical protein